MKRYACDSADSSNVVFANRIAVERSYFSHQLQELKDKTGKKKYAIRQSKEVRCQYQIVNSILKMTGASRRDS